MTGRRVHPTPIRFGTDGWRAVIADEFTFENVERVAQAYADFINTPPRVEASLATFRGGAREVVVGFDRRFMSDSFASCVAQIIVGNDLGVSAFTEDVPTPLISWTVRDRGAAGGVVITASHNQWGFNGFKIKSPWGGSATPETTSGVEALIDANAPRRGDALKINTDLETSVESYRAQVAAYVDLERLRALAGAVVIDPMHGAGGRWVESFLRGGRLAVETIRAERDVLFRGMIAPEPIDLNLQPLKQRVRERGALVGLATDGDADRVGAVNELGETMTMHEVVPLILLHLARVRGLRGGVVRTFSQSVLLKRIAAALGLQLHETPIGFKYIADLMLREEILIGAEESGGIGVRGHIPERDGILNSLLFLETVAASGRTPTELVREMHREFGEFYFGRRDSQMEVARGLDLVASLGAKPPAVVGAYAVESVETLDGTKLIFGDESWLLFRQSGTEPALRVYSEATSVEKMNALLDEGCLLAETMKYER
ncbi:MAG: phosphoglucomutase/phosphomannomutase family protein [Pyrinomonadaceae bacterium]